MKNTLEGTNSRITESEEWISDLEDRMVEITAVEQNKGKRMKSIEDPPGLLKFPVSCVCHTLPG